MTDLSNYPYPEYDSNIPAASVVAALIGIAMIAYTIESIFARFKPPRLNILILFAYIAVFVELILRAALPTATRNSRAAFTVMTVLRAISLRTIILANYDLLTHVRTLKTWVSRTILIGSLLGSLTSAILMIPAGSMSYDPSTIDRSFRLRQASAAIMFAMTVIFYVVWIVTKTVKCMTKLALTLTIISSISCFIVSLYLVITSTPDNYIAVNKQEFWFYVFQFTPLAVAQIAWTILHPKRTLPSSTEQQKENTSENPNISLETAQGSTVKRNPTDSDNRKEHS